MPNPFQQRATEYLRDPAGFLSIVAPELIEFHLKKHAENGILLDRLVVVAGTPGSGKTTMARLLQLDVMDALWRSDEKSQDTRAILNTLSRCKMFVRGFPAVAAIRLPLESEYRDYWELPYEPDIKMGLLMRLLQARAVLGWLRNLAAGAMGGLAAVHIIPKGDAQAGLAAIGGLEAASIERRAIAVERAVYGVGSALVPPPVSQLPPDAIAPYQPFDVIESFVRTVERDGEEPPRLTPLVLFDDAHSLHPEQFAKLKLELMRRELRVARWLVTRLDALSPQEILQIEAESNDAQEPGTQAHREITPILFQGRTDEGKDKETQKAFRQAAESMADRYLRQMPTFHSRGIDDVAKLLEVAPEQLPRKHYDELDRRIATAQKKLGITSAVKTSLEKGITDYIAGTKDRDNGDDVQRAMLLILMHRYVRRNPQRSLFETTTDEGAGKIPVPDASVAHGARLQLMHEYGRAYYYGMEDVIRASSGNAEHFLHFIGHLVALSETQLIRGRQAGLKGRFQHDELRKKANELITEWNFPYCREVRILVKKLAEQCLEVSLAPNARLSSGAGAIGVPQAEIDDLLSKKHDETSAFFAKVLKFGVAYNAFQLRSNYKQGQQGGEPWCLIELDGVVRLAYGLTLYRGGFIERKLVDLQALLQEPGAQTS